MSRAFWGCSSLKNLNLSNLDTSNVTNVSSFLHIAPNIKTLDISNWNLSKCTNMDLFLGNNLNITDIYCERLKLPDIELKWSGFSNNKNLSITSLLGLINALPTTTKGRTLIIGTVNLDKLSEDQKAIATNKGWILV